MTPQDALVELLARLGAAGGAAVFVSEHELNQWPSAAVATMKAQRLLAKASPATSAVCPGCERECVMPVYVLSSKKEGDPSAFIVCDKRSDINRVAISVDRLAQWQCSADAVCSFVAVAFGLRHDNKRRPARDDFREIGMANGNKRTQMLCMQTDGELHLVAGSGKVPLTDLIEYQDGTYLLDGARVSQLVDSATTADNRYTPSKAKREARKLDTQAMYAGWQKAYRELKKKRKDMSETWYSQQIAKMDISKGRDAGTIKKHMKP